MSRSTTRIQKLTRVNTIDDDDIIPIGPSDGDRAKGITFENLRQEIILANINGLIIQAVRFFDGNFASGTTIMPFDDTIPQNTEGDEFMTLSITPTSATSLIVVDAICVFGIDDPVPEVSMALFKDSIANAVSASSTDIDGFLDMEAVEILYSEIAGTTSTVTWKVRAGVSEAGTLTFNGNFQDSRRYGGVCNSTIHIYEISQ